VLTTLIILPDPSTGVGKASCFQNANLSIVECRPECPEGYVFVIDDDVLAYPDDFRKVAVKNECIPEYVDKFTSECKDGEVLNATDEGCVCQPSSTATKSTCCK
jgi:hypothetical protein